MLNYSIIEGQENRKKKGDVDMQYTLRIVTKLPEYKAYIDFEEELNDATIKALAKEKWVYKQEKALVERINFILGRGGKLSIKSNSVNLKGMLFGERSVPLQLPGIVQGAMSGENAVAYAKRDLRIVIPLHEFYDTRQFPKGLPEYLAASYMDITAKRVSTYTNDEQREMYRQTEKEVRKDPNIDNIFRQGPNNLEEARIVDYYYLQRPKLEGVEYTLTDTELKVNSPGTGYINIKPYKRVDREEMEQKRIDLIRKAKESGISVSYQAKSKEKIAEYWGQYEEEYKASVEMYAEIKKRFEHIRDSRGIRKGFRDDYYLDRTTNTRLKYEALNNKSSAISKIGDISKDIERLDEQIDRMCRGERSPIGRMVL